MTESDPRIEIYDEDTGICMSAPQSAFDAMYKHLEVQARLETRCIGCMSAECVSCQAKTGMLCGDQVVVISGSSAGCAELPTLVLEKLKHEPHGPVRKRGKGKIRKWA